MANGFERYSKKTKRALFLEEMEQVVPWSGLCSLIEAHYPKAGHGRPPVGLQRMLRIYFRQQWFNLSDPAVEEALYDSAVMRGFVGIDLGREPVPDETTVCKFRHLHARDEPATAGTDQARHWFAPRSIAVYNAAFCVHLHSAVACCSSGKAQSAQSPASSVARAADRSRSRRQRLPAWAFAGDELWAAGRGLPRVWPPQA